jgi:hypothetical protein
MSPFDYVAAWRQLLDRRLQAFIAYQHQATHDAIDWTQAPRWRDDLLTEILPEPADRPAQYERLVELRMRDGEMRLLLIHIAFAEHSTTQLHLRLTYLTTLIALETGMAPMVSVMSAQSHTRPDVWDDASDEDGDEPVTI